MQNKHFLEGSPTVEEAKFWNPDMETMPLEGLQERQLNKFRNPVAWACEHSPYSRRLYQDAGVEPGDIKTMADVRRAPATDKSKPAQAAEIRH